MAYSLFIPSADLAPDVLALAESMWAEECTRFDVELELDTHDLIAVLIGLDDGEGHDALSRCEYGECGNWFWLDDGAHMLYDSGADFVVCAEHAYPDDPECRVWPGIGLSEALRERDEAAMCARIRETGSAW